jgi:4-hydroxybenzoate polyprenyltransferase
LAFFNAELLNLDSELDIFILIFFLTHATYSLQRLFGFKRNQNPPLSSIDQWISRNFNSSLFSALISLVIACYYLFLKYSESIWVLSITAAAALLYVAPFKGRLPLREIAFIKSFAIAATWSVIVCLLPLLNFKTETTDYFMISLVVLANLFFVLGQCIPFDIRDLKYDEISKVKTLPQKIGIQISKRIAILSLFISLVCLGLFSIKIEEISFFIFWLSSTIYLTFLIYKIDDNKKDYYYSIGLELGLLLPFILLFLSKIN